MQRSLQLVHRCLVGVRVPAQAVCPQVSSGHSQWPVQSATHTLAQPRSAATALHQPPSIINSSSITRQVVSNCWGGSSNSWAAGLHRRTGNSLLQAYCGEIQALPHMSLPSAAKCIRYSSGSFSQQQRDEMKLKRWLQHEFKTQTLGNIIDSYKRPVSVFKAGVMPHPIKTVKYMWHQLHGTLLNEVTGWQAKDKIPGYDKKVLLQQVADMYKRINEAQANYQLEQIRDLVDHRLFRRMQAQAEERRLGRWDKMFFQLVEDENKPFSDNIKIVRGRMLKTDKQSPVIWLQFTFRISSQQRFAAYALSNQPGSPDKQATLVYGSPDELLDVVDYWVLEYKAKEPHGKMFDTWASGRCSYSSSSASPWMRTHGVNEVLELRTVEEIEPIMATLDELAMS